MFEFHMPVDPSTIEDDDPASIDPDAHMDLVSAENRLSNPPSLNDAV